MTSKISLYPVHIGCTCDISDTDNGNWNIKPSNCTCHAGLGHRLGSDTHHSSTLCMQDTVRDATCWKNVKANIPLQLSLCSGRKKLQNDFLSTNHRLNTERSVQPAASFFSLDWSVCSESQASYTLQRGVVYRPPPPPHQKKHPFFTWVFADHHRNFALCYTTNATDYHGDPVP